MSISRVASHYGYVHIVCYRCAFEHAVAPGGGLFIWILDMERRTYLDVS